MPLMKAVQVSLPGADFELAQKEAPEPKEGEVLIKVETRAKGRRRVARRTLL